MKRFESSKKFVSQVMDRVHAYETEAITTDIFSIAFLYMTPLRYAAGCGGLLLGLLHFFRIAMTLFSPVVCK